MNNDQSARDRIVNDLNLKLENFQVSTTGEKHLIQFDADVTHHQQEKALAAMTRPGISIEMLPVERQAE